MSTCQTEITAVPEPLKTFIIYARADEAFKNQLLRHLRPLRALSVWHDANIQPGEALEAAIQRELNASELILYLVSADALDSEYIQNELLKTALNLLQRGQARLAPIVVAPCAWQLDPLVSGLQTLPLYRAEGVRPVRAWPDPDEAWASVAAHLSALANQIQQGLSPEPAVSAPFVDNLILVKGGTFRMGSDDGAPNEKPVHAVAVGDFYLGKYAVTFEDYDRFCTDTERAKPADEGWGRGRRPVVNVSWFDAKAYCDWLSEKTGRAFRLPTEAEWEYAAQGGTNTGGFGFPGSNDAGEVAWYGENSGGQTHPVGGKKANELGLHDLSGNAWEWCEDWYHDSYNGAPTDGSAWLSPVGSERVARGGSWRGTPFGMRAAHRNSRHPGRGHNGLGFRVAVML